MTPPTTPTRHTGVWPKLGLLLWKNCLLQIRHKFQTLIDILLPVLMFVLLAYLQKLSNPVGHPQVTTFRSLEINTLDTLWNNSNLNPPVKERKMVFHPNNTIFLDLMKSASDHLAIESPYGVDEVSQLEGILIKKELIAAIEFHHPATLNELPKDLSYSLHFPSELRTTELPSHFRPTNYNWHTNKILPNEEFNLPRHLEYADGGPPSYYNEGFLAIQNAVARAFVSENANSKTQMPDVLVKRFPYPAFTTNFYWNMLQIFLPLCMLLSFNYSFSNAVRFIAMEKEKQLKEAMKIMGLQSWLHWLSWFLRSMTMLIISVLFIMILIKIPMFGSASAVFSNSNAFLLTTFFLVYCVNLTTLSFFVSTFFSKAKAAVTASSIIWYLSYLPYLMTHDKYDVMPGPLKVFLCIFPNTAMAYGMKLIIRNEQLGDGFIWSTMWRPINVYDSLTIGTTMVFLLLTACLFFVLTMYIESIFPGNYGVAKPWYFPFKKEFWCRSQKRRDYQPFEDNHGDDGSSAIQADPGNFEEEPTDQRAGVVTKHLSKSFGKNVVVTNLSMNMYNNQITVLLGHNGAGKTTTFSMLTGMIEPTSGTALIDGYDIRSNMDMARSSMGFCPQHNILFDELTVREHIMFYSRLKGLSMKDANDEVEKYVRLLELDSKIDSTSQTLSGGMKRKLSIGIALCGQSKVVFCDEPTSGMDAASRRSLWNVLIEEKKDRVIVLTTHFMDEADVLGDRIAIMAHGNLQCFGSSFFLKKRFGTGYHLICEKNFDCHSDFVTGLLRKYLPTLQIDTENESEITYLLPEDQVPIFKEMFRDLEDNEHNLNLKSYGVSLTTMEEIFLKFGKCSAYVDKKSQTRSRNGSDNASAVVSITENHFNETVLVRGTALLRHQAMAMFKKRSLCWLRSWKIFTFYNLIAFIILAPIIFQGHSFWSSNIRHGLPPLDISLDGYEKPITVVQESRNSSLLSEIMDQYQQNLWSHSQNTKVVTTDKELDTFLLNLAGQSLATFNYQYLAAASALTSGEIVAWFNNQFYHTAPLALNLVHNAIVRAIINPAYSIHVVNAPFDYVVQPNSTDDSSVSLFSASFTFAVGLAMPMVSASYIMFYIQEKVCRAKFLQYASGINLSIFWIASILWDVLTHMVTVVLIVVMTAFSRQPFWAEANTLAVIGLLFTMYNFAMIPVICLTSLIFSKPTTGMNVIYFGSLVISIVYACDLFIRFLPKVIRAFFTIYPTCTLISGLFKLGKTDELLTVCEHLCVEINCNRQELCTANPDCCPNLVFSWNENSVSKDLLVMVATSIGVTLLVLLIEQGLLRRLIAYLVSLVRSRPVFDPLQDEQLDDDVREVKERINAMDVGQLREQSVVLQNVSKFYGSFLAVNQVSLDIKQSECFGLLGNNGAGKTSIFKMLTGEELISSGEIYLHGLNLKTDIRKIYKCIGYCPQFDALFENLTGREILEIFALIRGVQRNEIAAYAVRAATDLDLIEHIDKHVSHMSGGNKRKLSTAIALVGNPKVVFLDEPTTGMDPATKRNLWNIIIKLRDQGKSIVLTSHSMEECEALCTQLTIMVNGNCKCYGSSQHLKNKFTRGFELKIKVKHDQDGQRVNEVKNYIANVFHEAVLSDEHQDLLTYTIPSRNLKWSTVFEMMENGKSTGNVDDYSVSQNSLENVLISFVKNQRTRNNLQGESTE
ncbi:ATP-binding cassette sub-family A member 3-like isoform X1 [Bradysia coprophila]|uniref:ATP-binding cassette sub-family A member 3-like isoform X1 n=1 Tax=Bradysia coprophila TaxID=38358 RepID=UPI00187DA130|nr:ATP-binding cassette sub-family A member 3-like isoform X1 [Bradysia coprophila]XP_037034195.1 ATP-binding cassette sub-family A member 3-like isoform X1 [Bradysia coprophila]